MRYRSTNPAQRGVTLVELLVALTVGVLLIGAVIAVYLAQSQTNKSTSAQASIQNAENAINALVTTVVRGAGFSGCATLGSATSNLNPGVPPPLANIGTTSATLVGYEAANTAGEGAAVSVTDSPVNGTDATAWSPDLDAALVGKVAPGSDVLVVLGGSAGVMPVAASTIDTGALSMTVTDASGFAPGQLMAVSDCLKTSVFVSTAVDPTARTVAHGAGTGPYTNATATFAVAYAPGAQVMPLEQTAFFVGRDTQSNTSVLFRAKYQPTGWVLQSLVPNVETMQVLYGLAANGAITQYVTAQSVTDWSAVASVRMAFLIAGDAGSAGGGSTAVQNVLGTTVTAPTDTRQRRVYEMTINLRNAAP
jgi:type IV pilus assembly protein PilW